MSERASRPTGWTCPKCGEPIGDNDDGYILLYERTNGEMDWPGKGGKIEVAVYDRKCDPEPGGGGYWISVELADTDAEWERWIEHLNEKDWFTAEVLMRMNDLRRTRHGAREEAGAR